MALTFAELARLPNCPFYWAVRGQFDDGSTTVAFNWGTRQVKHASKAATDPILLAAPLDVEQGIGFAKVAEVVSTQVRIARVDRIAPYLVGGATLETEYLGHSVYNLTCQVFLGYLGPNGEIEEEAVSPTLYVAGDVDVTDLEVSIPLASKSDHILGLVSQESACPLVTVEEIKAGAPISDGDWEFCERDGTTGAYAATGAADSWEAHKRNWVENLQRVVPYAYGTTELEMVNVQRAAEQHGAFWGSWVLFVSSAEPDISLIRSWGFRRGTYAKFWRPSQDFRFYKVRLDVTPAGASAATPLWVVWASETFEFSLDVSGEKLFAIPPATASLSHGTTLPGERSPAGVIQAVVTNHSEGGAAVIDLTSFGRAKRAPGTHGLCGGRIASGAAISGILSHVTEPFGFDLWIGLDDKLHILKRNGLTADDKAELAAAPWITEADIVPGSWKETIPFAEGQVGTPASETRLEFDDERAKFYGITNRRSPGATVIPMAKQMQSRVSGGWVFPPEQGRVFRTSGSRAANAWRRASATAASWIARYELGSWFRVRYSQALGANGAAGWDGRAVRLYRRRLLTERRLCQIVLVDFGRVEDLLPWRLDSFTNWYRNAPVVGHAIKVTAGSDLVDVQAGTPLDNAAVGDILWTDGAANEANRRHLKVTEIVTPGVQVRVEFNYSATETITLSTTTPRLAEFLLMKSHGSPDVGASYRPDYGRLCSLQNSGAFNNGEFENGDPGYRFTEG